MVAHVHVEQHRERNAEGDEELGQVRVLEAAGGGHQIELALTETDAQHQVGGRKRDVEEHVHHRHVVLELRVGQGGHLAVHGILLDPEADEDRQGQPDLQARCALVIQIHIVEVVEDRHVGGDGEEVRHRRRGGDSKENGREQCGERLFHGVPVHGGCLWVVAGQRHPRATCSVASPPAIPSWLQPPGRGGQSRVAAQRAAP